MKKSQLGIGIILFSILFQLCSSGMDFVSLIIGVIGLMVIIYGNLSKSE